MIPTVRELPLVGSLFALQSDALAFVRRVVHECGDMGRFHLGPVEHIHDFSKAPQAVG